MLIVELILKVDVCCGFVDEIVTLGGFNVPLGPEGETLAIRLIVPLKRFWPVTVIVEVADEPCRSDREVGFALNPKSGGRTMKFPIIDVW